MKENDITRCNYCFSPLAAAGCSCCHQTDELRLPSMLALGTIIKKRYQVGKVLGRGGFGIVYAAWDLKLNRLTAIKEFFPEPNVRRSANGCNVLLCDANKTAYRQEIQQIVQRTRQLTGFDNANIVKTTDCFKENGTVYNVMEYLTGETLDSYLQSHGGSLPTVEVLDIAAQIMDGLDYAHKRKIIHGDIKPQNIFIEQDGTVKLLEFAAPEHAEKQQSSNGFSIKSAGFAPWELYSKKAAKCPQTDVYALGAVIYYMLTGVTPPAVVEHNTAAPDWSSLPEGIAQVIAKAMLYEPADRWQTINEMENALLLNQTDFFFAAESGVAPTVRVSQREKISRVLFATRLQPLFYILAAMILLFATIAVTSAVTSYFNNTCIDSGSCGEDAVWAYYSNNELIISGDGAIDDYTVSDEDELILAPWKQYSDLITTVTIKEGITSIGNKAFYSLIYLNKANLPASLQIIGEGVFKNCLSLETITLPDNLQSIGDSAFFDCHGLIALTLPRNITSIEYATFGNCYNLLTINMPEGITEIKLSAFNYCCSLETITLPEGLEYIDNFAFDSCYNLESVYLPVSLRYVALYAFNKCDNLRTVYYCGSESDWNQVIIREWEDGKYDKAYADKEYNEAAYIDSSNRILASNRALTKAEIKFAQ